MAYRNQKPNNRISDLDRINYVKTVLQQAEQQTQAQQMYSPAVYIATAQQLANQYTAQDSRYPAVTFGTKEQKLRNQEGTVPELTATIGNQTSSSYFLMKDSLPPGTKASQEQLIQLRPDVVSARIATNLGIAQAPSETQTIPSIPPVPSISNTAVPMNTAVPNIPNTIPNPTQIPSPVINAGLSNAGLSKAQILAQEPKATPSNPAVLFNPGVAQTVPAPNQAVPPAVAPLAPPPKPAVDAFSQLVTGLPVSEQTTPTSVAVNKNPYKNISQTQTASIPNKTAPIHDREMSQVNKNTNHVLRKAGKTTQNIGQVLKDMARGKINPIQLYGDTLKAIGNFLEGLPEGFNDARLAKIAEQMNQIEHKKANIDSRMDRLGDSFLEVESDLEGANVNPVSNPVPTNPNSVPTAPSQTNESKIPNKSESDRFKEKTPIDRLLESNASIEDKLDAIEKTLDKMLEKLNLIENNLTQIEAILKEQNQTQELSTSNPNISNHSQKRTITETEVSTQVEAVVSDPKADVPIKTEIKTDIVAEAKSESVAAKDTEVPETEIDSPLDEEAEVNAELIDLITSFEGDLDSLNYHLQSSGFQASKSEDGQFASISEINDGVISPVFNASASGDSWNIKSEINIDTKLNFMESFIEAQESLITTKESEISKEKTLAKEEESVLSID